LQVLPAQQGWPVPPQVAHTLAAVQMSAVVPQLVPQQG
jgi:hypothetical protein